MPEPPESVTELLVRWNSGDPGAFDELLPAVYSELLNLARAHMMRERAGHTLSPTALVHEAYLKLVDHNKADWRCRAHFFGAASNAMRRVLVDHAKKKFAGKRGGSSPKLAMPVVEDLALEMPAPPEFVLMIDEALNRLAGWDERKAKVVEMKFFGGMTNVEIAAALSSSHATVERDWTMARAWLIQALGPTQPDDPAPSG
ncbi:MAG: RNA polymerase subunit sigma-70 [Acidobacteria bacterium]|nr:RNA polymerase subunit sigma-70 [Acidobacteriota bacterium]